MEQSTPRFGKPSAISSTELAASPDPGQETLTQHRRTTAHGSIAQRAGHTAGQARAELTSPIDDAARLCRRLLAKWKTIALATLSALLIGQLYLWTATPMYSSTASLFVDPRARKIDEIVPGGIGPDTTLLESQVTIMSSDGVLKQVVDKLKLADDQEFAAERSPLINDIIKALVPGRSPGTPSDRALATLEKVLRVSRAAKTYVIDVTATTQSAEKSAAIVNAVIDAYFADQTSTKSRDAKQTNALIDARLDELRDKVRQAELHADQFKKANQILTAEGGVINEQQLTRLSAELVAAKGAETERKAQRDQIQTAIRSGAEPDVLGDAGQTGLIARLREQYAQVARREASLSSQLQPSHPAIVDVRSQMTAVRAQITAELKRVATAAESAHRVASSRVAELEKQLEKAKQDLTQQNTAQIRERELEQEVATSRELLQTFLARSKATQEQENITTTDARVISPAVPANAPSRPIPLFVLAFSLLSGLTAGMLWALRDAEAEASIVTAADVADHTGTSSLSVIPQLNRTAKWVKIGPRRELQHSDLLAALDKTSDSASAAYQQAILRLLSKIKSLGRAGRPNTVMFASARAHAGNSAAVLATAYSAAVSGERVLLVDATSTNPELSALFAADLATMTTVILDSKEHLLKVVTRDERSGMSFLPIALADLRTLRIQQRRRLVAGLNLLSQDYDWIFIDAGALLDDEAATTLLPAANLVFVVARSGATTRADIDDMMQILEPARERIAGTVLTFGAT